MVRLVCLVILKQISQNTVVMASLYLSQVRTLSRPASKLVHLKSIPLLEDVALVQTLDIYRKLHHAFFCLPCAFVRARGIDRDDSLCSQRRLTSSNASSTISIQSTSEARSWSFTISKSVWRLKNLAQLNNNCKQSTIFQR